MHKQQPLKRRMLGRIVLLVLFALALYVVVPQVGGLAHSWQVVTGANKLFLGLGLVLLAATYMTTALTYQLLALKRLRFLATLEVQIAGGFAGKLLPAGLGTISLNVLYLHKNKHSAGQAAMVVGANNIVGFAGYFLAALLAAIILGLHKPSLHVSLVAVGWVLSVLIVGITVALAAFRTRIGKWWVRTRQTLASSLRTYSGRPIRLLAALGLSTILPVIFTGILFYCAHAVSANISFATAFAVFSAGLLVGTATPTPGGVVGAEAGLTAALVAYGITTPHALIVALLYRFVTYWLPLLPGGITLLLIRRRSL